ncbi:MAG TPA: dephospho-CoA kinase [Chloroflexota bacterium]|nr:dephospho-CoA kinase [Chloroflexota bacterium]
MRIVGLTGRIGTGKSTVARWLADLGLAAIDSDALVAELYERNAALQAALAERFGSDVLRGGRVDKEVLRARAQVPGALDALERLVHPAVHLLRDHHLAVARAAGAPGCVVEAIKLVESGGSASCDELWIVVAAEPVQLGRLARRGVDEPEARRRMAWQGTVKSWTEAFLAESVRLGRARPIVIFDNSADEASGRAQAARLWRGAGAA